MIRGINVTLYERTQTGTDGFGAPVYQETAVSVPNVLVQPTAADDVISEQQLYGKHSVYTLCLPKGDAHEWSGCRVAFFGETFKVFGPAEEYIEENVPGSWNRIIKVERYE